MYQKPSNKQFKNIFDKVASQYDKISNSYTVTRRKEFFLKHAQKKCLEVGAGTGKISDSLKEKGLSVIASDISPQMVKEIRKKKIKALVCDAEKLPFESRSFDTIISAESIYYLDHPEKFISEAHRILKPRGNLLISSANNSTRYYDQIRRIARILGFSSLYFDDPVLKFMFFRELKTLLENGGFEILEVNKVIIFPFKIFDKLNKFLEQTIFRHLGAFILIKAKKN